MTMNRLVSLRFVDCPLTALLAVLLFVAAPPQTSARNIYFPLNQAVYFADDQSLVDPNVMNALHDRVAPSRHLRIQQNFPHMEFEEAPARPASPLQQLVDTSKIAYGRPPAADEPSIQEIIGELDVAFPAERLLDSSTNETVLAGGGCFCCRAFVCQRQKKCPCSRFVF